MMLIVVLLVFIVCLQKGSKAGDGDPKIAFLFLTRGPMPLENIWHEFFRWRADRSRYSIYIHPHAGYHYPPVSLFHGKEVEDELVEVAWGGMSQVRAIKHLVSAALQDPLNERFCLFSEACIPLVPFAKWYRIMMAHPISIVNACPMNPDHMELGSRWAPALEKVGLRKEHWRKSATWFALTRKHAEVFVLETESEKAWESVPCCDEHYLPTILAWHGLDNETTCTDGMTFINWESDIAAHPKQYSAEEVDAKLLTQEMQQPRPGAKRRIGFSKMCSGFEELCHFAGRKFSPHSRFVLMELMQHILSEEGHPYTGNAWDHRLDKVRMSGDRTAYYLIENGVRRIIPDNYTFEALHIPKDRHYPSLTEEEKRIYPKGPRFPSRSDGTLLQGAKDISGTVWIMDRGRRRRIPDWNTFVNMGLRWQDIIRISQEDLEQIFVGQPVKRQWSA